MIDNRVKGFGKPRKYTERKVRCGSCEEEITLCPKCSSELIVSIEKGVDAHIVTDPFILAWKNAYDIGILVTSDADFVLAVERIQERGVKIINGTWHDYGFELSKTCWASFELDDLITQIRK